MKTSNLLLLVLFVISVSFISAIPLVVNMKLKGRDFEKDADAGRYDHRKFGAIKFVALKGLTNAVLIPSDSVEVEVETSQRESIVATRSGDTLFITNRSKTIIAANTPTCKVYLPVVEHITCSDSRIELRGSVAPEWGRSYDLDLVNSQLVIQGRAARLAPFRQFFNQLVITGTDSSGISLSSQVGIRRLDLINVRNTLINGSSVDIEAITTTFDPKAVVKMKSVRGVVEISAER